MRKVSTRRNVFLLACCQGLLIIGLTTMLTEAALVGHALAANKAFATLPIGVLQFGVMAAMFPASFLMRRVGRRIGFSVGAGFGIIGAAVAFLGVIWGSFWLFCLGALLTGIYNAFAQFYRFAAVDGANEGWRSKGISYVLAGGVLAALVGPELAKLTKDLVIGHLFAGSFAALIGVTIVALLLLQLIDIPLPSDSERQERGRPLGEIVAQPAFIVAVLAGIVGYTSMSFVMTATPLAMVGHSHRFDAAASVIQWHIFAMFAPSFVTGHIIKRFGLLNVIRAGAALTLACAAINLSGTELVNFWLALVLLGIGWNFMFIGGTTLLTATYRPAEKAVVQACNDFLIFGAVAIASFGAGIVLHAFSWQAVNYGVVPFVIASLVSTYWLEWHRRRVAATP